MKRFGMGAIPLLGLVLAAGLMLPAPGRAQEPVKVGVLASVTTDFAIIGKLQKDAASLRANPRVREAYLGA